MGERVELRRGGRRGRAREAEEEEEEAREMTGREAVRREFVRERGLGVGERKELTGDWGREWR